MAEKSDFHTKGQWLAPILLYLIGSAVLGIWYASKLDSRLTVIEDRIIDPIELTIVQKDIEALRHEFRALQTNLSHDTLDRMGELLNHYDLQYRSKPE